MGKSLKILFVANSEQSITSILKGLNAAGYETAYTRVDSAVSLSGALEKGKWDLVIGDHMIPDHMIPDHMIPDHMIPEISLAGQGGSEAKQVLQAAIEQSIPIGIAAVDTEGKQIYVNDFFCSLIGSSREELLGAKPPFVYWVQEEYDKTWNRFDSHIKSEEIHTSEVQFRRKSGEIFTAQVVSTPLRDQTGKKIGQIGTIRDITERLKIERALEESEERYRKLFELAPDAIFVSVEGQIVIANSMGAKLLGVSSPIELLGKRIPDFAHEDTRAQMEDRWRILLEKRQPVPRIEIKLRRMDGTIIYVEAVSAPVLYKGREAVQTVFRDITERKRTEEVLQIHQKQLRLLASKVSLAAEQERHRIAGDIHDGLGQTLSLIKMKLDIVHSREHAPGKIKSPIQDVRKFVEQAIAQIHSIIHELSPPILHRLDLESALEWLVNKTPEDTGLPVSFTFEGTPFQLPDDAKVFLFHAAGELIHNAAKYAQAKQMKVLLKGAGNRVELCVEDDGIGFDPAQASEKIGETGGFGLFNIGIRCEQMGGTLKIDSRPGTGARITLTIPS